jgi:hypothetical protein
VRPAPSAELSSLQRKEFHYLFGIADFRLDRIVPTGAEVSVIEARKVR